MDKLLSLFKSIFIFFISLFVSSVHAKTFQTADHKFIAYSDIGQGKPIVLIHAFPTDRRLWEYATKEISDIFRNSKTFRIITLDLWGFGQSSPANGQAITMSDYADEVKQLLDYLNIQSAVIGGESMGGYISLAFLEKYPKTVEGLILSNTQSIADSAETKTHREAAAIEIMENGTKKFITGFLAKALSPDASKETRLFLTHMLKHQNKEALASGLRGMALRADTSTVLAHSSLPILILSGEKDIVISPQQSQNMHALAKSSKLVTISNAGHLASLEQPKLWAKAVIEMFNKYEK